MSRVDIPTDTGFMQKANAIMKAAGMAADSISIEQFRLGAPAIFIRAFEAIYKCTIPDKIVAPLRKEDQIYNGECFLSALYNQTNNGVLENISGSSLADGEYEVIGILVAILFAEGQRLWAEKIKQKQIASIRGGDNMAPPKEPKDPNLPKRNLKKSVEKKQLMGASNDEPVRLERNAVQHAIENFHKGNLQNASPSDLQMLMERIAYLENKLNDKTNASPVKKKKIKRKKVKSKSEPIESASKHSGNEVDSDDNSVGVVKDDDDERSLEFRRPLISQGEKLTRRVRPSSAPARRRPQSAGRSLSTSRGTNRETAVDQGSNNDERNGNDTDKAISKRPKSAARGGGYGHIDKENNTGGRTTDKTATEPTVKRNKSPPPPPPEGFQYTYDMKSGRRILLSIADIERLRCKDANGIVKDGAEFLAAGKEKERQVAPCNSYNSNQQPAYTAAAWPSQRTERSVMDYVKKAVESRKADKGLKEVEEMPKPRIFGAYQRLSSMDLVISIEYCHNCQYHNVSLRHDPEEYCCTADAFLRTLGNVTCCLQTINFL